MRKVYLFIGVLFFISCASVDKYNQQISKLHTVQEVQEDIDFTYKLLQKYHPELYYFIPKDSLDKIFSNLRNSFNKPISGTEFYRNLAPVVGSIKQGHTSVFPAVLKQTKQEIKINGKRSSPFKSVKFKEIKNKIYISKIYSNDSTLLVGSEVLKVDEKPTDSLLNSFHKLFTSDGFNNTFYHNFKGLAFGPLYERIQTKKDSVLVTLKIRDSIYSHYLVASYDKSNKEESKIDSSVSKKKKITKEEKRIAKKEKKAKKKWESKYGFDTYRKEKTRDFKFIATNSDSLIAYMKIRRFNNGDFESFFEDSFSKIDSAKSKNIIIDLRDNLGGSVSQIDDLYSYLTDKNYTLLEEPLMTRRMSYIHPLLHSKSPLIKSLAIITFPIHTLYIQGFKVRTKNKQHFVKLKYTKERSPKPNNFKGNIYVIINGTSFSASTTLSTHLKATKRAIFVGEESGGAYNGTVAGTFVKTELPNSKLKLRFGIATINTPYRQEPDGFGVKADVIIPTTDLEKDVQLEWILENIKNKF